MAEATVCDGISNCAKLPGDIYRIGLRAGRDESAKEIQRLKARVEGLTHDAHQLTDALAGALNEIGKG